MYKFEKYKYKKKYFDYFLNLKTSEVQFCSAVCITRIEPDQSEHQGYYKPDVARSKDMA